MLAEDAVQQIRQAKMNALSAKHLHEKRLRPMSRLALAVDILAVAVPVLYWPVRYFFRGTAFELPAEIVWELLAGILAALAALKLGFQWQERFAKHARQRAANLVVVREADALLAKVSTAGLKDVEWFLKLVSREDETDGELLAGISAEEKMEANRAALKEFNPGKITLCLNCNASPWEFKAGSCQMCGGTPVSKVTSSNP
jgi:mobilome CxxCx(11)CxxC protein